MNDWERLHRQAEEYKESYPPGTRVMLLHMNDPYHPIDDVGAKPPAIVT